MKYLLILLVFVSCNPLKKAIKTFDANPGAAAQYCAEHFPARDSIILGDTVTITDTITEGIMIEVPCDTVTLTAICPPAKVITKIKTVIDTVIRIDQAKVLASLHTIAERDKTIGEQAVTINRIQADFDKMKDKRNWWRMVALILAVVLGLGIFLQIKRII
jgi:hypothetical protein